MLKRSIGVLILASALGMQGASAQSTGDGVATGASATAAQSPQPESAAGTPAPPFSLEDPERIEKGRIRFGANCAAYCHGFEGSGGKTPAFRGRKDLVAAEIFNIITVGRVGSDVMPAWGNGFSEEKRWELVAYIMYLTRQPPK